MTIANPSIPADAKEENKNALFNETTHDYMRNNTAVSLRAASTASASVALTSTNFNARGVVAYFNIASFPGSASTTLALKIQAVDPVTGGFSTLLAGAARSATGTSVMMIGPGISASALGVAANLPRDLRFLVSQSSGATGKKVVFSIGLHYTV